jgi:hypothetical protein
MREDFFLYVDEFHNFTTDTFASALSEARKYHLCLTVSHQYLDQVDERVLKAVFGNVGTIISFRVGEADAEVLAKEFGHVYTPGEFSWLDNFEVLVKLLSRGQHGNSFRGRTLSPMIDTSGRREQVIRRSRERYASRRHIVEDKIDRWMGRR